MSGDASHGGSLPSLVSRVSDEGSRITMRTVLSTRQEPERFYLWMALAMSLTVYLGFWFTYFGPIARGEYQPVAPIVHVHGWSFFLWYLLLPAQAGLIRAKRVKLHRSLGIASTLLAAVIVFTGLTVASVRVEQSRGPEADPFWTFMGLPIFVILLLFVTFYVAAILNRRHPAYHKRLILLASAAAMAAATFRVLTQVLGFVQWVWVVGVLATNLFVLAAVAYDYWREQKVHRVYRYGLPLKLVLEGGVFLLVMTTGGDTLKQAVGWIGRYMRPFY